MYKLIPNALTMLNLLLGCMAIAMIMGVHPRFVIEQEQAFVIEGMDSMYWGSILIGAAAVMDMVDGLAARLLKAYSPIGGDLDSLADLVSFGVAPAMILYQLLWRSYMMEPGALSTPMMVMIPAFAIVIAGAYRLARFNKTPHEVQGVFTGLPIPAVGLVVASLPLVLFYNYQGMGRWMDNRWIMYGLIAILSYLMVSTRPFMKWNYQSPKYLYQIIIVLATILGAIFFNYGGILIGFVVYVVLSIFLVRVKTVVG